MTSCGSQVSNPVIRGILTLLLFTLPTLTGACLCITTRAAGSVVLLVN